MLGSSPFPCGLAPVASALDHSATLSCLPYGRRDLARDWRPAGVAHLLHGFPGVSNFAFEMFSSCSCWANLHGRHMCRGSSPGHKLGRLACCHHTTRGPAIPE